MENINNETALPKVMPLPAGKAIFVWCNNPETGYCYLKISYLYHPRIINSYPSYLAVSKKGITFVTN